VVLEQLRKSENRDVLSQAIEVAQRTSDTYTEVFLLIQQQAARKAAAAVNQAQKAFEQEMLERDLLHLTHRIETAAQHFDRMYQAALAAPEIVRPALLGVVRQAAAELVRVTVEAGGEEEAATELLAAKVLQIHGNKRLTHRDEQGRFASNGTAN
jgi:hypothetical protein